MKVALLTNLIEDYTGHINIGDVFIRLGMQYILQMSCSKQIEWVLISRFVKFSDESIAKMKECELIVYAGMPQYNNFDDWYFYYDAEMWDDLNQLNIPILRLAGGGGYHSEVWTPDDFAKHLNKSNFTKYLLNRSMKNVVITTTRDKMVQRFLETNGVKSTLLPCTGTYACVGHRLMKSLSSEKTFHAICLTASYIKDRPDREVLMNEFKKTKDFLESTGKKCVVIAQVRRSDAEFLHEYFGDDVVYTENSLDIIEIYYGVDICVSTRLHCALPIHGIGGRVVMVRVDTRAIAVEELEIPIINLSDYTHEAFMNIYDNDLFSKVTPQMSIQKSIAFYYDMFEKMFDNAK